MSKNEIYSNRPKQSDVVDFYSVAWKGLPFSYNFAIFLFVFIGSLQWYWSRKDKKKRKKKKRWSGQILISLHGNARAAEAWP